MNTWATLKAVTHGTAAKPLLPFRCSPKLDYTTFQRKKRYSKIPNTYSKYISNTIYIILIYLYFFSIPIFCLKKLILF